MNLIQLSHQVNQMVLDKYTTYYKASQQTGLARMYFSRVVRSPNLTNILKVAEACNFKVTITIE